VWESVNPVLADGELGIEIIVSGPEKIKVGDGVTHWNDLDYAAGSGQVEDIAEEVLEEVLVALEPTNPLIEIYENARDGV
jgi:hypothetical protein